MSDFLIRVMKWLAAIVTAYFLLFAFLFLLLIGVGMFLQPVPETMQEDSVLVLDLGINLTDQPSSGDAAAIIRDALSGDLSETVSLRQLVEGIERAASDKDVHGLLLTGKLSASGSGGSFATLREVRQAIVAFSEEKPVWSFIKTDSLRDYYLKSAATEVISDPYAIVDYRGLRAERLYMGEAFKRLGIEVQSEAFEEYKTAAESFKEGTMSEPEREQLTDLVKDLWHSLVADIAASRDVAVEELDNLAGKDMLLYAEDIPQGNLADLSLNSDELEAKLVDAVGYGKDGKSFRQFDFIKYLRQDDGLANPFGLKGSANKVAVLHIEGIIMDGESSDGVVGAETINAHLEDLREDRSVKAVVLRVNSPGGGADASNRIVREIQLTKAKKPVVVSMGGVAASGGYMVAAVADYVFAQPTSITGSIGVVSILPNIEELAEKLSLSFEGVETHKFAGTFSLSRAKTEEEMRQLRALNARTYDEFMQIVADGRDMSLKQVRPLAKGRIWSGKTAVKLGLVDKQGGLMSAVRRAADLAGIGDDFSIEERPRPLTLEEQIEEMLVGASSRPAAAQFSLRALVQDLESEIQRLSAFNDPHGQYLILPYSLNIR